MSKRSWTNVRQAPSWALVPIGLAIIVGCAACSGTGASPTPAASSFPSSEEDVQELMHDCMAAAGWDGVLQSNGVYDYMYSEEQRTAFEAASTACVEQIGGNLPVERTDAEWHDLYDFYITSRQCIQDFGIDTPPAPSFTAWKESGYEWSPYAAVIPTTDQFEELIKTCPQTPDG